MSPHRPRRTTADAWASAVARSTGISWSSSRISRSQEASEDVLAARTSESSESRRAEHYQTISLITYLIINIYLITLL